MWKNRSILYFLIVYKALVRLVKLWISSLHEAPQTLGSDPSSVRYILCRCDLPCGSSEGTVLQVIWGLQHINIKCKYKLTESVNYDLTEACSKRGFLCCSFQWDQSFRLLKEIDQALHGISVWYLVENVVTFVPLNIGFTSKTVFDLLWFSLVK